MMYVHYLCICCFLFLIIARHHEVALTRCQGLVFPTRISELSTHLLDPRMCRPKCSGRVNNCDYLHVAARVAYLGLLRPYSSLMKAYGLPGATQLRRLTFPDFEHRLCIGRLLVPRPLPDFYPYLTWQLEGSEEQAYQNHTGKNLRGPSKETYEI